MRHNKTSPRVKDGRVLKKNRTGLTAEDGYALGASLQVIRQAPGPRQVQVLDEYDLRKFLALIPGWPTLGAGVNAIVLANDSAQCDGFYRHDGVIQLCSWREEIVLDLYPDYFEAHRPILDRIGVPYDLPVEAATAKSSTKKAKEDEDEEPTIRCWFEPTTARDFMLMHIFLHELGHHHDHRTLRRGGHERGEEFAESWAIQQEIALWPRYRAAFSRR